MKILRTALPHLAQRYVAAALTFLAFSAPAAMAQGTGYWHTSGNRVLDANNTAVRIAGINWYGFETTRAVAGGLTSQDSKAILQTIKALGYNTVRIPLSNQMVEMPSVPSAISYSNASGAINGSLQGLNSLQILDVIVQQAGSLGLKVILDNHRSEAGDSAEASGLWYTSAYPESAWINDWTMLANRYAGNSTVIGFDLRNEPHNANSGGACWDCGGANDWHLAAARAGNAVLAANPKLLLFVEGTDAYNNDFYWWGGNLEGVANSPVVLSTPNQLVYAAHDYGPTEYAQTWFNGSTTSATLNAVWTTHWGYVAKNGIAPVWLGEFGTTNDAAAASSTAAGSEGQWFSSLVSYLAADSSLNWTYWALNGEDSYGLLDTNYDPTPVSASKQSELASIQFALNPASASGPAAPSGLAATAISSNAATLSWTRSTTSGVRYTVYYGTAPNPSTVLVSGLSAPNRYVSGLLASTTYFFAVKAVDASGNLSAVSNQASTTTKTPAAPGAPSGLVAAASSSSQINLSWTASATGNVTYSIYTGSSATAAPTLLATGVSATSYAATGLAAGTPYYFTVKAVSTAGGVSAASNQASATTQAGSSAVACHISYSDTNDWGSGFSGAISIANTGSSALNGWTLTWSFTGNQQVTQAWSANFIQSGSAVTLTNASYNGAIAAGATLTGVGFNANYSGINWLPNAFYINGVLCQ